MKKKELILLGVMFLAVLLYLGGQKWQQGKQTDVHGLAVIKQDGQVIERIDLDQVTEKREIILPGPYHEIIEVEPGRIRFQAADCPDKICVHSGWLQQPGDMAVCIPNRAVVKIED